MGLTQRSAFVVFGLLGGIVTAAPAAADLLLVQEADFNVHAAVQITNNGNPDTAAHSQNGDQNNNPFNANVTAQTIPNELTLASSAQLDASWGASNISANGEASFNPMGHLSSGISSPMAEVHSNLSITFQVQTDATYELQGNLASTHHTFFCNSEISLMNSDTSVILQDYISDQGPPISFSGTLSAGVNYQLNVDATVFFQDPNVLENLEAQFDFNMELMAVPAPGAFGLFLLSGIIGRPKRRR